MNTLLIVLAAAGLLWLAEKRRPSTVLPRVRGWYRRCLLLNALQAMVALASVLTWDRWFQSHHVINIGQWPIPAQVFLAYVTITFIYYWWHRARHTTPFLWRWFHQTHHSPTRLEVITSFYKHPAEMLANGILSSSIVYLLLGVSPDAAGLTLLTTALAELFYHTNLRTPYWLGFIFQRPEMHRAHHAMHVHHHNYSDLPVWDIAFGTFRNPKAVPRRVGFPGNGEQDLRALLLGKELTV